jgi:Tol biopolymer transport system component
MNYYQIKDKIHQETILFPELLKTDGHPTLHPTGRYLATDTYIINGKRHVYIIDLKTGELHTVATFDNPKEINGDIRCDPHPRWNRDGTQLCYDGLNKNGERQIFILDFLRE